MQVEHESDVAVDDFAADAMVVVTPPPTLWWSMSTETQAQRFAARKTFLRTCLPPTEQKRQFQFTGQVQQLFNSDKTAMMKLLGKMREVAASGIN